MPSENASGGAGPSEPSSTVIAAKEVDRSVAKKKPPPNIDFSISDNWERPVIWVYQGEDWTYEKEAKRRKECRKAFRAKFKVLAQKEMEKARLFREEKRRKQQEEALRSSPPPEPPVQQAASPRDVGEKKSGDGRVTDRAEGSKTEDKEASQGERPAEGSKPPSQPQVEGIEEEAGCKEPNSPSPLSPTGKQPRKRDLEVGEEDASDAPATKKQRGDASDIDEEGGSGSDAADVEMGIVVDFLDEEEDPRKGGISETEEGVSDRKGPKSRQEKKAEWEARKVEWIARKGRMEAFDLRHLGRARWPKAPLAGRKRRSRKCEEGEENLELKKPKVQEKAKHTGDLDKTGACHSSVDQTDETQREVDAWKAEWIADFEKLYGRTPGPWAMEFIFIPWLERKVEAKENSKAEKLKVQEGAKGSEKLDKTGVHQVCVEQTDEREREREALKAEWAAEYEGFWKRPPSKHAMLHGFKPWLERKEGKNKFVILNGLQEGAEGSENLNRSGAGHLGDEQMDEDEREREAWKREWIADHMKYWGRYPGIGSFEYGFKPFLRKKEAEKKRLLAEKLKVQEGAQDSKSMDKLACHPSGDEDTREENGIGLNSEGDRERGGEQVARGEVHCVEGNSCGNVKRGEHSVREKEDSRLEHRQLDGDDEGLVGCGTTEMISLPPVFGEEKGGKRNREVREDEKENECPMAKRYKLQEDTEQTKHTEEPVISLLSSEGESSDEEGGEGKLNAGGVGEREGERTVTTALAEQGNVGRILSNAKDVTSTRSSETYSNGDTHEEHIAKLKAIRQRIEKQRWEDDSYTARVLRRTFDLGPSDSSCGILPNISCEGNTSERGC